jgi:alpha-mannosidase
LRQLRLLAALSAPLLLMSAPKTLVGAGFVQTGPTPRVSEQDFPAARDTLFLVGDARIDPEFLVASEGDIAALRSAWRRALGFAEWTNGAVLVADGAMNYMKLREVDPTLADSIRSSTRAGAWAPVGGWWSRADPGALHGEALIRQGLYGQRAFADLLGRRPTLAWLEDGMRLPSTLPQILSGSGLNSVVLIGTESASTASGAAPSATETPTAFTWEGNDGTRLPASHPFDYGDFADFEFEFPGPEGAGNGAGGSRLAIYGVRDPDGRATADEADPEPSSEEFQSMGDSRAAGPVEEPPIVRFASPARALAAIRDGAASPLPAVTGEILPPPSVSGASRAGPDSKARGAEAAAVTRAEARLQTAEAVAAVAAGLPGAAPYPGMLFESAWRELLEAVALSPHQSERRVPGAATREALNSTTGTVDSIIADRFAAIRAEMETDAEPAGGYVLFNPLAQARRGVAFVDLGRGGGAAGDGPDPRARELALVNVPEIPSMGAIVLPIGADGLPGVLSAEFQPPTAGDLWLENAFLRVEIDPVTGAIASVLDKTNRRQALRPGGRANALIVTADPDAALDDTAAIRDSAPGAGPPPESPGEITRLLSISSSVTARAATVTITRGWNRSTIRQQLVLARAAPFLEVRSEIRWQDAGWLVNARFDPVVRADSARFAAPYGSESRAAVDSRHHPALHWVDVSDGSYGLSVIGEPRDAWRFDGNSISTRLPSDSSATTRFAIFPHAGDWRTAGTAALAAAYVVPLIAALEPPHGGRLGRKFSLVSSDDPAARIEWVKRAEDDGSLVLRLVERSGRSTETRVSTACPEISAWRADHLEEPLVELPSSRAEFRVRLRAYEIATVRVACRE